MPSSEEDHLKYRRMPFKFGIKGQSCLSLEQSNILYKYGSWMEALVTGSIKPRTKAQEDFIAAHRGRRKPETSYEIAWERLQMRREFEGMKVPTYNIAYIQSQINDVQDSAKGDWWSRER
jgi:uncharacterized protein YifE (UPF0438 family)